MNNRLMWALGAALLVLAYQSLWQPAMWVYNDRSLVHPAITSFNVNRILATATWAMTNTPEQARLVNLLLHACNVILVGLITRRIMMEWAAIAVALAWALHPLNVETIAYGAGRSEILAATGVLIAVLAAVANGRFWCLWAAFGLVLGLAAKESAVVTLGLVPLARLISDHKWRLTVGSCAVVAIAAVIWFGGPVAIANMEIYSNQVSGIEWALVQSTALARLVWLAIVPFGQTIDYDYDIVPVAVRVLCVAALLICTTLVWIRHRTPLTVFGLAWLFIAVAPRLIVQTPRSYLNEHQFYVPLIGLAVAGGGLINRRTAI